MIAPDITVAADGQTARGSWYLLEPASLAEPGGPQAFWLRGSGSRMPLRSYGLPLPPRRSMHAT
jgi:hypothetical protein